MNIMIPAVGWAAVYEIDAEVIAKPLVAWVSTPSDTLTIDNHTAGNEITGMVVDDNGKVVRADSVEGFKTYEYDLESATIDYLAVKNGN